MDLALINAEIARLISTPETALLAGVVAAFTPCTLALIPIFLYRFGIWGGEPNSKGNQKSDIRFVAKELGLLLIGYMLSFVAFGWLLNGLFGSDFINIVRLTLGSLLVFFGLMQLGGQISFSFINKVSNPLVTGAIIPLIISLSPCVLPVIAPLVAGSGSTGSSVLTFTLFGIGILIPAIVLSIGGNRLIKYFRKSSKLVANIERFSAILILASGIYLSAQLINITGSEVAISALVMLILILGVAYSIFRIPSRRTVRNIAMLGLVGMVWIAGSVFAETQALAIESLNGEEFIYECSQVENHFTPESINIAGSFGIIAGSLGWFYLNRDKASRSLKLRF